MNDPAMGRHFAIVAVRFTGIAFILLGILALRGAIDLADGAGYVLIAVGLLEVFLVPMILVRRWRTPRQ
ncbi:hypothetical protein GRI72_10340 [Altererythrobacter marinus]|uniref:Uncharacterized protein n=1 Tax=Pelagerythrobacter marinus TaxID=538382 RepID=A0ABW9UZK1_9SPHN|nr:hypothetical protein [Pelagerythrobacter marinus]MXO69225.1 hypothetical protein [Pelagerythrobacter marinus]